MSAIARMLLAVDRAGAGLRQREIQVDDHRIVYSEGGHGEPILLLHGFGAESGSWNHVAKFLTKRYHVIAPNLPGWGTSTRLPDASYAYPEQVERVHRFVQEMKLTRFHLAGHSIDAVRKCEQNRKIFDDLQKNDPPLLDQLAKIQAPALVIWGDHDELVDVSAVDVFKRGIKSAEVLILKNSGHMPLIENPRECADAYLAFLGEKNRIFQPVAGLSRAEPA